MPSLLNTSLVALGGALGSGARYLLGSRAQAASRTRQIHSFRFETLSESLPIITELVDSEQHLAAFLGHIEGALSAGLVTLEKAQVKFHRPGKHTIGAQAS